MIDRIRIAAAVAAIAPMAATAADTFYLTAAGGYSWAQTSKLEASHGDGFDFQTGSGQSENHGAWRVGAGWFVLPRVALEAAYADYGRQSFTVEGLFRVARAFLVPFLLSWTVAYVAGEWRIEWLYYAGLGGVGISIIGLMVWLLHQ